jgi:hypothetical protein
MGRQIGGSEAKKVTGPDICLVFGGVCFRTLNSACREALESAIKQKKPRANWHQILLAVVLTRPVAARLRTRITLYFAEPSSQQTAA